jgi:hypothetical protein
MDPEMICESFRGIQTDRHKSCFDLVEGLSAFREFLRRLKMWFYVTS